MVDILGIPETSFSGLRTRPALSAFMLLASILSFSCGKLIMLQNKHKMHLKMMLKQEIVCLGIWLQSLR